MSKIPNKNTGPEIQVRSLLHALGYRFRLHRKDLPGTPDIVLPKYKAVIQVQGCFWHRHAGCKDATVPKSNTLFWNKKFETNVKRDHESTRKLAELGWKVVIIWQCELKDLTSLTAKIEQELPRADSPK